MDVYNSIRLARTEHEAMVRSLPPVLDYDNSTSVSKRGRVAQHAGQMLAVLGSRLNAVSAWMKSGQAKPQQALQFEVRLVESEPSSGCD